jgi:hypothetical protein
MVTLLELQQETDKLSSSEREQLIVYLLSKAMSPASEITEEEVDQRDAELDSGHVSAVTHAEFIKLVRG